MIDLEGWSKLRAGPVVLSSYSEARAVIVGILGLSEVVEDDLQADPRRRASEVMCLANGRKPQNQVVVSSCSVS